MRFKLYPIVYLISMFMILNCNNQNVIAAQNEIMGGAIQKYESTDSFIIKFSNLIFEKNGKEIKIPVFQGNMGDVTYREFHEYCYKNGLLKEGWGESGFVIRSEKGKLTKTFREFLYFYKKSILKNTEIDKPSNIKIYGDGDNLEIFYDFNVDDIPFVLQLNINTKEKFNNLASIKTILQLNLNENLNSIFTYRFWKNKTSKEL